MPKAAKFFIFANIWWTKTLFRGFSRGGGVIKKILGGGLKTVLGGWGLYSQTPYLSTYVCPSL